MSTPSKPIALPVTAVTCLEDRAHVERTAVLDLEAGVQRLRLGPVGASAVDRTLHAELTADHPATVLDVRIVRDWTPRGPRPPAEDDSALRRHVHALEEERDGLEQRVERLRTRLDLLGRLATDLLREIGEGAGAGETDGVRWNRELDRVDAERDAYGEELRAAQARLAALATEIGEALQGMSLAGSEPAELVGHVELTVESSAAGPARLRLSHLTPCALWRPAYRAVLDGDRLTLETDAVVWQRTGEDWSGVRLTLSTARSALATDPPRLGEDRLTLEDRSPAERRTVDVELREEEIGDLGPAPVLGLPGVDDGGEARVLHAPAPVSVPADGRAHRVPLSSFTTAAGREYACSPELSPLVTEVVRCDNLSGHALLAGPVDLVRGSGFSGRGTLEFTAPGAPVELAFGSRDDHRVVRCADESRDVSGLTQRTVVTRTVTLHLSRFSAPGERDERVVVVRERVPVSEVSAVEVRLRRESCSPAPDAVDAEGIVRWDVPLAPGGRRTVTLVYEVSAKGRVVGV
ncbi:mucoidy inhibitor MuiA family protein [Streptomyces sp. WAC05374]|uniref:mucoidy inhibitor MuiA family protein n=1 Tax=Streptomyces sp. WAC05374 TaxID=2487420 RepID=UPI000F87302B|nr:mucoidy inhibitor MuiA family protein [Streptomyces sp. WAC05374]RST09641.1 mucoidy inhibitor MuiA family protein [Streptomyces sp. WAC05374]TDF50558.1 mucoidy inhibitor MuiA family protein [Streptomyces sp. WAC05374]TDF56847.1 mucoidy inhibitor MuiA family protein [Streptomyces sp. WAC05374]TDF60810.1 mucoidy inhibitor MuiA family protein [Streptomyces sp. WAC05374]